MRNRLIALIPAYEPDVKILGLTDELREKGFDIVVVDDGSRTECERDGNSGGQQREQEILHVVAHAAFLLVIITIRLHLRRI